MTATGKFAVQTVMTCMFPRKGFNYRAKLLTNLFRNFIKVLHAQKNVLLIGRQ
jgi:hypothetical protein